MAGLSCGVLMAPVLPYLTDTDEQLEATVAAIAEAGAVAVTPLTLHLRPGAREWFFGWARWSPQRSDVRLSARLRCDISQVSWAMAPWPIFSCAIQMRAIRLFLFAVQRAWGQPEDAEV